MSITVRELTNPFAKQHRSRRTVKYRKGMTVNDILTDEQRAADNLVLTIASRSGRGLQADQSTKLRNGDEVTMTRLPRGIETIGMYLLYTAISAAVSYGVSRLLPVTTKPDSPAQGDVPKVHTFTGLDTSATIGTVIPIVIGTHVLSGNVIAYSTSGTGPSVGGPGIFSTFGLYDSYLSITLGLCWGEIAAVTNVQINGLPAENYAAVLENRLGTITQTPVTLAGSPYSSTPITVGLDLLNTSTVAGQGASVTITTINQIDTYQLNVLHSQGLYRLSGGSYQPHAVQWRVRHRLHDVGGGLPGAWSSWQDVFREQMLPSPFVTTTEHQVTPRAIYDIEVQRWSPAPTLPLEYIDTIRLDSVNELVANRFAYPRLAILAARFRANEQLNGSIPTITCTVKGLRIKKWDGVDATSPNYVDDAPDFSNPAWAVLTLLRDKHIGLGLYIDESDIDLESFKSWADWCDEMVPADDGNTEKRCQFDGVFEGNESAWSALLRICATARATLFAVGQTIRVKFEHPRERWQLFSMGNIKRGSFSVQYVSQAATPNRVEVRFLNRLANYQIDVEAADDQVAVDRGLPQITETIEMFGITRPSQARREAMFRLNMLRLATTTVTFEAAIDAIHSEPGDIVDVQHDLVQWGEGGRIRDATDATVRLDRDITMLAGKTYVVLVEHATTGSVETRTIASAAGTYPAGAMIALTGSTWSGLPPPEFSIYSFGEQGIAVKRIVIQEITLTSQFERRIVGYCYDPAIHNDTVPIAGIPTLSTLPNPAAVPACLAAPPVLRERLVPSSGGGSWESVIDVSWQYPQPSSSSPIASAQIWWRQVVASPPSGFGSTWFLAGTVAAPVASFVLSGTLAGESYEVIVMLVSPTGAVRTPQDCIASKATITIRNVGIIPAAPASFTATVASLGAIFGWAPVPGAAAYEIRRGGDTWQQSLPVGVVPSPGLSLTTDDWSPTA